jgi:hypothetical protein
MPRGNIKTPGSVDTSRTIRAAVTTLCVVAAWDFDRISRALGIPKSTCSLIVRRASEVTGNNDIIELLDYTAKENNCEQSGVAVTNVWPHSATSITIQDAVWWFPRETWEEV